LIIYAWTKLNLLSQFCVQTYQSLASFELTGGYDLTGLWPGGR